MTDSLGARSNAARLPMPPRFFRRSKPEAGARYVWAYTIGLLTPQETLELMCLDGLHLEVADAAREGKA